MTNPCAEIPTPPLGPGERRYPTLYEAIYGRLKERSWHLVGPAEAAGLAEAAVTEHAAGTLPVCNCGYYVVLCQHHQPWTDLVHH